MILNDKTIPDTLQAALSSYRHQHRGTGRTTTLLSIVNNGDVVLFCTDYESHSFRTRLKDRSDLDLSSIGVYGVSPKDLLTWLKQNAHHHKKVHIDHYLLELFYTETILQTEANLAYFGIK